MNPGRRARPFGMPRAGDVVMCLFPEIRPPMTNEQAKTLVPGKRRPAIVVKVLESKAAGEPYRVLVGQGTSNLDRLFPSEVLVSKARNPAEFETMGLKYDTRFKFEQPVLLPYSDEWFVVSQSPSFPRSPKMGSLHPRTIEKVRKALACGEQFAQKRSASFVLEIAPA